MHILRRRADPAAEAGATPPAPDDPAAGEVDGVGDGADSPAASVGERRADAGGSPPGPSPARATDPLPARDGRRATARSADTADADTADTADTADAAGSDAADVAYTAGADVAGPRGSRGAAAYGGSMPRVQVAVAGGLGLLLGLLALGPALAPGFTLAYDMVFVPRPVFTRATFGLTGMLPRQVPSDAVVTALAQAVPADVVQKAILLGIFVLACVSAARLVPSRRLTPRLVAGVVYAWNPFVAERLLLGQWALLLGYAALPAVAEAAARGGPRRLACALVPAAVGGFAALAVSVPVALAVAACRRDGRRGTRMAWTALILLVAGLPWLLPGLLRASAIPGDAAGVSAFAARADTPFGALGSLLLLGGAWNAETVPPGYGTLATAVLWACAVVLALVAYAFGGRRVPGLGPAAAAGFAAAALGVVAGEPLGAAVHAVPALAVLRDGQQYVAPLAVLVAVGAGLAVDRVGLMARRPGPAADPSGRAVGTAGGPGGTRGGLGRVGGPGVLRERPAGGMRGLGGARDRVGRVGGSGVLRGWPAGGMRGLGGARGGAGRAGDGPGRVTPAYAVPVLLVPLVLLPGLAWGAGGRLHSVRYPADWERARAVIVADPGAVLVLPWEAYRSYPWNGGRRVLDPLPRFLPVPVVLDDSLRVATRGGGTIRMAAEDPRVRALDPLIRSRAPLTGALAARGVRYVAIDLPGAPGAGAWPARLAGAERVVAGPGLVLYRLPDEARPTPR